MNTLREIYNKHSILDFHSGQNIMSFDQFKQALTEVFKLVEVTDEEIKTASELHFEEQQEIYFRLGSKWLREMQQTKLEQFLKTK